MKKSIAYIICLCCIACSTDKKTYTENGLNGSVKTMIEKEFAPIEQRFGKWEATDSTKPIRYILNRYDSNGNKTALEYHIVMKEDYVALKTTYTYHDNKRGKATTYDYFGKMTGYAVYKYLNNNQYTETSYDSSGNITYVSTDKINPLNRDVYYYDYTEYENGQPVSQFTREDIVKGDTIIISTTNKKTGITSISKSIVLEKDAMGNDTKVLHLDSTNTKPEILSTRTYEYY